MVGYPTRPVASAARRECIRNGETPLDYGQGCPHLTASPRLSKAQGIAMSTVTLSALLVNRTFVASPPVLGQPLATLAVSGRGSGVAALIALIAALLLCRSIVALLRGSLVAEFLRMAAAAALSVVLVVAAVVLLAASVFMHR